MCPEGFVCVDGGEISAPVEFSAVGKSGVAEGV